MTHYDQITAVTMPDISVLLCSLGFWDHMDLKQSLKYMFHYTDFRVGAYLKTLFIFSMFANFLSNPNPNNIPFSLPLNASFLYTSFCPWLSLL